MHTCVCSCVHLNTSEWARRRVLLYGFPPFSLETGSLTELEWDQQSPESLCFPSPTMLGLQTCEVHDHTQFFTLALGYKHRYIPCAYGESPYLLSYLSRPHNPCVLGAVLRVEGYLHESPRKIHSAPPLCWGPTVLTRHTLTPRGGRKMTETHCDKKLGQLWDRTPMERKLLSIEYITKKTKQNSMNWTVLKIGLSLKSGWG